MEVVVHPYSSRKVLLTWDYYIESTRERVTSLRIQIERRKSSPHSSVLKVWKPSSGYTISATDDIFQVPQDLSDKFHYVFVVKAIGDRKEVLDWGKSPIYKPVFSTEEMKILLKKATKFVGKRSECQCRILYRNKPRTYFDNIQESEDNVMRKYMKDHNGDPSSPINGRLEGLFFSPHVNPTTNKILRMSPFGDRRLHIPVKQLYKQRITKLYFADFYCTRDQHYVTLVLTQAESQADKFCSKRLVPLDVRNNPFLYMRHQTHSQSDDDNDDDDDSYKYLVNVDVHVEVFYTEDIDLEQVTHRFSNVKTFSRGQSRPKGLPKKRGCKACNLY